jgi:outer membrane protein assembly factor BamB
MTKDARRMTTTAARAALATAATAALLSHLPALSPCLAAEPGKKVGDWPMWGGSPDRNMVSDEKPPAIEWDVKTGKNIKWRAPLGSQTYGNPVIANGRVYVGTNNNGNLRPNIKGDKGVVVCVDEKTGKFLWQATHDKLPTGQVNDWPEQGICSSPCVVGDRVYYVSNRCELVCADANGMANGNDGPFEDEKYKDPEDADFIWILDMIEELGVFPHNLATSSPVVVDGKVFVITSNGVDEGHLNLPAPVAPAFICVDAKTGEVLWTRNDPGKNTLHGQWSSPAYGVIGGEKQVIFAGGDGWCYSFNPDDGKPLWKFNLNPEGTRYVLGGKGTKNYIISTPVIHDDAVFLCVGQDPEHGEGVGHLYRIDATKRGDITKDGAIWHVGGEDFHRSLSTAAIKDGRLYHSDLSGYAYCFDVATGKLHWKHDTFAAIWGSMTVIGDKVYLGTEDGEVHVFEHQPTGTPEKKLLATNDMGNSVYTTPVAANGVLFITNRNTLFAIQEGAHSPPPAAKPTE